MGSAEQRRGRPAGRGWGEVSGDRLAEKLAFIEQMANECVLDLVEEDDVLALVEIAKAARVLLAEYEEEETEHGFPFNFALRDAHRALRAALARLDSGAVEGDA